MNKQLRVLIVYNEPSKSADDPDAVSEAGVLDSVVGIEAALYSGGHMPQRLGLLTDIQPLVERLRSNPPDVIFNLVESFAGRPELEAHLACVFELFEVPFTGSPPECLSLVRNKAKTKLLFRGANVPTAEAWLIPVGGEILREVPAALRGGPLFVKPVCSDASEGVLLDSVVEDEIQLVTQVRRVHAKYGDALVERFIDGREFNVGILDLGDPIVLPLAEMEFQLSAELPWRVITYNAKWMPDSPEDTKTQVRCPAAVEPELAEQIRRAALAAYLAVGARDYARVDIRVDRLDQPYVLEVNGNPDLDPQVGLARELRAGGWSYEQFIAKLVEHAAHRGKSKRAESPKQTSLSKSPDLERTTNDATLSSIVRELRNDDIAELVRMTAATGVFRPDEVEVAEEVLRDAIADTRGVDGYRGLVAAIGKQSVGWSCHSRIPLTDGSFDLFWIVVDPKTQGQGIGRLLLNAVEAEIRRYRGRWLFAETSSLETYLPTRQFYLHCGFEVVRESPDFYRPGDGLIVFGKRFL